ncbi:MAG TPA: S41 family peptidase [Candidatus Humimicrobiaceae bacterium]|nr:S41 family peptidase [Candidatus Humimicrobiaceae bacterium]
MTFKKALIVLCLLVVIFASLGFGFRLGQTSRISSPSNSEKSSLEQFLSFLGSVFGEGNLIFGEERSQSTVGPPEGLDFSLFWEAWYALEENFVDSGRIDYQKMIYGAISGMTESLGDTYTVFMTPEDLKIFEEDVAGEFEGVGMEIGIRKDQLTVIAPLEGTPAEKAGLRAGDKIIKIDDKETRELPPDIAVKYIRGPKGTEVTLTIFREGWSEPKEFIIIRDVIEVPSLKWELVEGNIAYIKLYHFTQAARSDFNTAALEILNSPAKKIILDLRNNGGGFLQVAQDIAGWFLKEGDVVTIEDAGSEEEQKFYRTEGPSRLLSYPIVVLINEGSASASEILAGALRDNRGIKLIGEDSFGKGSIQELEELSKGGLKITIARWLTPKGELIADRGLEPDIKVEMTDEDYEQERDLQLDKAIEVIK